MDKKFFLYFIGFINLFQGILGLFYGKTFIREWKEVTRYETFLWLISGIVFILVAYRMKSEKYTICPKCKETYRYSDLKDGKCTKCNIDTVDIEDYYKDHPVDE